MHQGIVLRSYMPNRQKVSILDYDLGRIEAIVSLQKNSNICIGSIIEYTVRQWRGQYILSGYKIIDFPTEWAKGQFLFLHHVLELCYYFLPLHESEKEVFNLLTLLYKSPETFGTKTFKKIFLCRFFNILGIHPNDFVYDSVLLDVINNPLNFAFKMAQSGDIDKKIQHWLMGCITTHNLAHRMKTINFQTNLFLKNLYDADKHD